jgi:hypothetical protein
VERRSGALSTLGAVIDTSSTEVVDAHPVLAPEPIFKELAARPSPAAHPATTAAAAAGGFVAGAAMLGLVHRRHSKRLALASARPARRLGRAGKKRSKSVGELMEVVATRTLLVDVHLLGPVGRDR